MRHQRMTEIHVVGGLTMRDARFRHPARAALLSHLAAALAVLGDNPSRASGHTRDVRLHVVGCQAQHLAGEVLDLLPAHDTAGVTVHDPAGLPAAATAVRSALDSEHVHPLPRELGISLGFLLELAQAVTP
jgi:hypothetical protein